MLTYLKLEKIKNEWQILDFRYSKLSSNKSAILEIFGQFYFNIYCNNKNKFPYKFFPNFQLVCTV